ncbi:restriction endonuclease [Acinetobacter baumannii]
MKLKLRDITIFNRIFGAESGYLLDFSDRTLTQFFDEELNIDIDDEQYKEDGTSKAKRVRCLLKKVDADTALYILDKLWLYRMSLDISDATQDLAEYLALINSIKSLDKNLSTGLPPKNSFIGIDYTHLISEMDRIKLLLPHPRGYAFEVWLNELFKIFQMAPKGSFRNTGEQIDGSFRMDGAYYLMEAKWQSTETPASDLHSFQGKLNGKASWTRGVFISWQGFSRDGLIAFGKGNRIICISGKDIYHCLKSKIPFPVLLEAKLRHASETGECYIAYEDIKNLPKI